MISKHKKKHNSHPVIPRIRAPKGYSFKVKDNHGSCYPITISLHKRSLKKGRNNKYLNDCLGNVKLAKHWKHPRTLLIHSTLLESYHNKGLGSRLYAKAIQVGLERGYRV